MRLTSAVLLLVVTSATTSAQPATPDAQARAAIRQAEEQWNQAFLRGDVAAARVLMADNYVDVNDDGTFDTRETTLAAVGSDEKFTALSIGHLATRLYGDIAVNTGTLHMALMFRGKPSGGDFLFTDVWQRRNGTWQILASAETPTKAQQKKDKGKPKPVGPEEFKTAAEVYRGLPQASDEVTSAIVAAERTLDDAFIRKDRAPMQSLLADDYVDTWDDGFRNNKEQDIKGVLGSRDKIFELSPFGAVVFGNGELAIHVNSVHGRGHYQGLDYDENLNTLDVWHREPGGWRLVATQAVASARQPGK